MTYYAVVRNDEYLEHHGIKGQKWGIRRFQNEDGSLTAAGEKRYNTGDGEGNNNSAKKKTSSKKASSSDSQEAARRKAMMKKVAIGVGVTAAIVGTVYASKKLSEIKDLKADLDFASGRVFETPSKKLMSKNWDHYSLGTKLKLARQAKEDKNSRWRVIDHISSEMYNTKKHKTLSSHIEDFARRRKEASEAKRESDELLRIARHNAREAYLNKPENFRNTIDSYYKMADGRPMSATAKARVMLGRADRSIDGALTKARHSVMSRTFKNQKLGQYVKSVAKEASNRSIRTAASAAALYGVKRGIKHFADKRGKDGDKILREMFPKKK